MPGIYNTGMQSTQIRRTAGAGLLLVSLVMLGWSLWPVSMRAQNVGLPGSATAGGPDPGPQLAFQWPGFVRIGETAEIRLELSRSPQQSSGGAETADLLTARLDLPGLAHTPSGETSQSFPSDRPAVFRWSVRADRPGVYAGTVWLYSGDPAAVSRRVISAQRFELSAGGFLGLSGRWAQALGLSGSLIGAVFCLDGLVLWFSRRFRIQ